ncbi:MAG: hypothetical protein ACOCZ9_01915 [Spirochaetota bacterium]
MKYFARVIAFAVAFAFLASGYALAQDSFEDFDEVHSVADSEWEPAAGSWDMVGGDLLVQDDTSELLARIDRPARHSGSYELSFNARYLDGGYASDAALRAGEVHAGFGFHVGVDDPPLGVRAWGNDESYLVWGNVDTRRRTREDYPEHYGLQVQVYRSNSNTDMELVESVDLGEEFGITADMIQPYLDRQVPVRLRVDNEEGVAYAYDPTDQSIRYRIPLPEEISGEYLSLRTNSVSIGFSDIVLSNLD